MQKLADGIILYHGSYCQVQSPDLKRCSGYKDFGKGFYLMISKEQAKRFIRTSVKKAALLGDIDNGQNFGFVSSFSFAARDNLQTRHYAAADVNWLHCVVAHRAELYSLRL